MCRKDELGHARVDQCAGAHRTRLERDGHARAAESPLADMSTRATKRHDLRVRRRIRVALALVGSLAEDLAVAIEHGADGHFALQCGTARQQQRTLQHAQIDLAEPRMRATHDGEQRVPSPCATGASNAMILCELLTLV